MCQYVSNSSCHFHLQTWFSTSFLGISWVSLNLGFSSEFSFSFHLYIISPANSCRFHFNKLFPFAPHPMAGYWWVWRPRPIATAGDFWWAIPASEPHVGLIQTSVAFAFSFTSLSAQSLLPLCLSDVFWSTNYVNISEPQYVSWGVPPATFPFHAGCYTQVWTPIISYLEYYECFITGSSTHWLPFYNQSTPL